MSSPCHIQSGKRGNPAPAQFPHPPFALSAASIIALGMIAALPQAHADDTTQLPAVTVTATPSSAPAPDASVAPGQIASKRASTSDTTDLLSRIPGAAIQAAGGISGLPVLDGMADDRLAVSVDGASIMAACANHMNPPLSYIAPTAVQSIDVYSGVAPVSVGGDSIGGAVVVKSAPPVFASDAQHPVESGELGAHYRSNGQAQGADLKAGWANDAISIGYSASVAEASDYTAGGNFHTAGPAFASNASVPNQSIPWIAADQVGSTAYLTRDQQLSVGLKRDNQQLVLKVDVQRTPEQLFPNQRMDMVANDSTLVDVNYTGRFGWGLLEATVYNHDIHHVMNFGADKQFYYGSSATPTSVLATGMPMDTQGVDRGGSVKGHVDLSPRNTLTLGTEIQNYSYNEWWPPSPSTLPTGVMMGGMAPNTFWNINGGQRDRLDLFAELETRWTPQWQSTIGLRSDRVAMNTGAVQGYNASMYNAAPLYPASTFNAQNHAITDQNLDFSAIASYTPDATKSFSFGYAQKTRSPNLYERYTWSTSTMAMEMIGWAGDGNYYIGNLNLKPEVAHTLSATADLHDAADSSWDLKATPYFSQVDNYIGVRRCPTSVCGSSAAVVGSLTANQGFVYLQFANTTARIWGVDVSGHAALGSFAGWGSFTATGVVSWVRGEDTGQHDNLYNMMPLNATLGVEQSLGGWSNRVEEQLVAAKSDVSWVHNEVPTAGYALLNLRSSYTRGNWRVDFGVENALNKFYDLPLGGAYLGQGATMGTSAAWGTPVPGMGRSVYTGVTMKF